MKPRQSKGGLKFFVVLIVILDSLHCSRCWKIMGLKIVTIMKMRLSYIFSDMDSEIDGTLSRFTEDTKLSGAVNKSEGWDAIWRDLDRLERRAERSLTRVHKAKCKVLHLGGGSPRHQCRPGDDKIKSSSGEVT